MRRIWLLLILTMLGACAGLVLWWQSQQQSSVPMIPLVPAQRIVVSGDAADATATPATAATPRALPGDSADRIEPPSAPVDDRVAELVVELLRPTGPAAPGAEPSPPNTTRWAGEPLPDVEIEVEVAPGSPFAGGSAMTGPDGPDAQRLLTDAQGLARFRIAGGNGRSVVVRCPVAATATAQLRADGPVHLTLRFTPRAAVRGTVVDAAGRGVAGASLLLLLATERDRGPPRVRQVGRSRADGSFELLLGVGGRFGAQHAAYAPSAMYPVPVQSDPTQAPLTTVLQLSLLTAQARVQGRVVDAAGLPVADAELEFWSPAPPPAGAALVAPPQHSRSAAGGAFEVQDLRPGRIEFSCRAAGHGGQRGAFDVAAGSSKLVEIRLQPACEVHGRVEDEQGAPVAAARVWSGDIDSQGSAFVVTRADGTFQLRDLPPGPVSLTAREGPQRLPDGAARRAETRIELQPGQIAHWVATLQAPPDEGFLRGQVLDGDGARLPTWRVEVRSAAGTTAGATDSGGFFHVRLPGPGPLDVFVRAPGAPAKAFAQAVQLGIDPARAPVRIVVDRRLPWGRLAGRVQTSDQQPLPATLTCWHHEREELARFQAADDGTFRLDQVPPGTVDLHVEHAGQARLSRIGLVVLPGEEDDLGTLVLESSAVLFGQVMGPDGQSPAQLQVTLLTSTQRIVGEYSAGTYRFAAAPPGRHVLQVQGPSVAAANFVVELQAGIERQQDMQLLAGVPRRIVVVAPAAVGPVVSLALRLPGAAHTWFGATAPQLDSTTAGCRCDFEAFMAPGTYEAIAWTGDGWEGHGMVTFVPGEDSPVQILLAR